MRFMPLLTALLVALALYGLIMERDTLRAFASGEAVEAPEEAEPVILAAADGDQPIAVVVDRFEKSPVQSGIVLTGQTEAARNVDIRAETTGLVISEPTLKGASIAKGDVLCRLDPGTREASLAEAEARLREADTVLETAKQLTERGFSSETDLISREAGLESARARVKQAEKELDRLTIRAPFDGILETDTAELGSLMQQGGLCATLIALDPIRLVGFVPETAIDKLQLDNPAGARLVTGQELTGRVTFLSRSADELTRTFRVEVTVPNPDLSIRDGVTAEILIGLDGEEGHLIPQSALTLNDDGQLGVRTNRDSVAHFMPVSMIRDDAKGAWVSGLPDTVEVIITGQDFVRDGRAISVSYKDNAK